MADPRLEIQMLHDRVMVAPSQGERCSGGGTVIPATARIPRRLVGGAVPGTGRRERDLHAGVSETTETTSTGTGPYL